MASFRQARTENAANAVASITVIPMRPTGLSTPPCALSAVAPPASRLLLRQCENVYVASRYTMFAL